MLAEFRPALVLLGAFSLLTGVAYPAVVTLGARALFPRQAEGSLIRDGATIRGSELIGQPFSGASYFWSRPSATGPAYNAAASSGSNLGPSQSGAGAGSGGSRGRTARRRSREHGAGACRSRHRVWQRDSIHTLRRRRRHIRSRESRVPAACPRRRCSNSLPRTPRVAPSGCSVSRG